MRRRDGRTRVAFDGDELSFLVGLVRMAADEADEQLEEPITPPKGEEREWLSTRATMARAMESKLMRAGRRL